MVETAKANKLKTYENLKNFLTEIPKCMDDTNRDLQEGLLIWLEKHAEEYHKKIRFD